MKSQICILLLGIFTLISCSGGEGESSSSAVVNVAYPPPSSNVGGKASTIVTGSVTGVDNLNFLDVNGVSALFDLNDPTRWSANINIAQGNNIDINVSTGGSAISHKIQNREVVWEPAIEASVFDDISNKVYYLTSDPSIVSIDVSNGDRRVVTGSQTGLGIQFERGKGLDVNAAKNKAYVVSGVYRGVMSVDLITGDRSLVSSALYGIGTGPDILNLWDISVDSTNNKAYVVGDVGGKAAVVAVDLVSGDRSVIYYTSVQFLKQIEIDITNNRAYVIGGSYTALLSIDLDGGGHSFIADNLAPDDYTIESRGCCAHFDPDRNRMLISDAYDPVIYTIDVVTGTRGVVLEKTLNDAGFSYFLGVDSDKNRLYALDRDFIDVDLTNNIQTVRYDQSTGEGVNLVSVGALVFDAKDTIYLDGRADFLMTVDVHTGNRKIISSSAKGAGPQFNGISDLVLSGDKQTAYVLDKGSFALMSVELFSGNRAIISDNNTGVGQFFSFPHDLVLDENNNRVLVVDNGYGIQSLQSVDLITGDRTILSSKDVGDGVNFISPKAIASDYLNNRVFVIDFSLKAILEVDLDSGDRIIVSGQNAGVGPNFLFPTGIACDLEKNYCLVIDSDLAAIIKVDMSNGNRSILSNKNVVPEFFIPSDIVINKEANIAYVSDQKAIYAVELSSGQRAAISQ